MGEECDELTPVRQWIKSVSWMRDRNTMESVRTYKNGTKCNVIREVSSSEPDKLLLKVFVDDVISLFVHQRIKE